MSDMRTAKTISITMPPELLAKAQELADREHRTMSELMREALRRYLPAERTVDRKAWDELLVRTQAHGRSIGITSEEDVDRILGEFRTSDRA
jgi:Arc/MetJ-type ribon-helix-helix transcriptional regulator